MPDRYPELNSNRALIVLLALAVFTGFFYGLGNVPLFDLDEGAFSEATREMFLRGDFMTTFLNGEPRYDKPILIYWLQAASAALLGFTEFAMRLPSALAASAWVGAVFVFTRATLDTRRALIAAIITASSLEVTVIAKAATADALLNLWIAAATLMLFRHYQSRAPRHLYLAALAMGLGFLTKGPIAVVLPVAVATLFGLVRGEWRFWLRVFFHPGALGLLLIVALPWYVLQYVRETGFIEGFFLHHNLDRFSQPMESHRGNVLYYIPVLLVGLLPYTALLLSTFAALRERLREPLTQFLLIWFVLVLGIFSFSGTKLPHYLLYGLTPLFILMARQLDSARRAFWLLAPALLLFGALAALPSLIDRALPGITDTFTRQMLTNHRQDFPPYFLQVCVAAAVLVGYFVLERRLALAIKLMLTGVLVNLVVAGQLLPAIGAIQQQPIKEAARVAREQGLQRVVLWTLNTPSFNFYSGLLSERRPPQPGEAALAKATSLDELPDCRVLYLRNGVALVARP